MTSPFRGIPSSASLLTGAIAARCSLNIFADASGTALMRLTASRKIMVVRMRFTTSRKNYGGADELYDVEEYYGRTDAPYDVAE